MTAEEIAAVRKELEGMETLIFASMHRDFVRRYHLERENNDK